MSALDVLDEIIADMGGDTPGTVGHRLAQVRDAFAELIAQRDAMANALRKLDLIALPAAIKYRSIGSGDIEEAQEIVRAALARVGGAQS